MDAIIWIIGLGLPIAALIFLFGWLVGFNASEDISNWGSGWDSGYNCGWKQGYAVSLCRRKDITGREIKRVYRIKKKYTPEEKP